MLTHPKPPDDISPTPSPLPQRRASEVGGMFLLFGNKISTCGESSSFCLGTKGNLWVKWVGCKIGINFAKIFVQSFLWLEQLKVPSWL